MVEEVPEEDASDITENVLLSSGESVLMQTAKPEVKNPRNFTKQNIRMLLDTGSQRMSITENLAKTLNLTLGNPNNITLVTFGSKKPQKIKSPSTTMDITLRDGSTLTINANVIPSITRTVYRGPIYLGCLQKADCFLNQYDLADTLPCKGESSTIDLLVRNDYYLDLVLSKKVEIQPVLYRLESNLGWILSGRTSEYAVKKQESSMLVLTYETDIERETHLFTSVDKLLEP